MEALDGEGNCIYTVDTGRIGRYVGRYVGTR
jgi:hypothetical protein